MVIFKLFFLSYMATTVYVFYHANSIAMLYPVHKYKKQVTQRARITHLRAIVNLWDILDAQG